MKGVSLLIKVCIAIMKHEISCQYFGDQVVCNTTAVSDALISKIPSSQEAGVGQQLILAARRQVREMTSR